MSPTHLHEFKSADKIYSQPPVMSLYLPDQKLGSHSSPDSSSHKFMLKGRQSGAMHRGHSWVFRAESYDTMMAWFDAIKMLTEKTGAERDAFVRQHVRSLSTHSHRPASISSDGLEEDEADQVPYSAASSVVNQPIGETKPQRPLPGEYVRPFSFKILFPSLFNPYQASCSNNFFCHHQAVGFLRT